MPDASFLDAQLAYENLGSFDIDAAIAKLDRALYKFGDRSGYTGEYNTDYGGNDIWCRRNLTYDQLKAECDADSSCVGFNTVTWLGPGGCIKHALSASNNNSGGAINFYKKTNNNGGYNPELRHDYAGNDIWCNWYSTEDVLRKTCDSDPNCIGYNRALWNTGGCVKNKNAKSGKYYATKDFNFYTKTAQDSGEVQSSFAPIADYYSKLSALTKSLQNYISKSAKHISDAEPRLVSEERYGNRLFPEESVMPREATSNFFSYELKTSFMPYLLAASVFMACLCILLIFQMNGFSGQVSAPLFITQFISQFTETIVSPAPTTTPMLAGGALIVSFIAIIIYIGLSYKVKNTNTQ